MLVVIATIDDTARAESKARANGQRTWRHMDHPRGIIDPPLAPPFATRCFKHSAEASRLDAGTLTANLCRMANATGRIGNTQHFVVQMPGGPGSFRKAARAAGIKPDRDSMSEAIETTSFKQAIVRGNYWCGVNGITVDKSAPHGFNFIDTPEYRNGREEPTEEEDP
jgi:hypothetical protein